MELVRSHIENSDVGNINNFEYIVMGMSKSGTTSIQDSLNISGLPCIKFHSDFTLLRVFHDPSITAKSLIEESIGIFVPYRNPINRKVSQYYFYGKSKGKSIEQQVFEIRNLCLNDYSLFNKGPQTEIVEEQFFSNLENATGIDVLQHNFNKDTGFSLITKNNISLVPFTIEYISYLAGFLKENIAPDFQLVTSRVSKKSAKRSMVRKLLKFNETELDIIFNNRYCAHFYSEQKIEEFKQWERDLVM